MTTPNFNFLGDRRPVNPEWLARWSANEDATARAALWFFAALSLRDWAAFERAAGQFGCDPRRLRDACESGVLVSETLETVAREHSTAAAATFYQTNIGAKVWDTLDRCLRARSRAMILGESGRGKSAAAEAWCAAHLGQACFVRLPGSGSQLDVSAAIAAALGISTGRARMAAQLRHRIADVLRASGLMLVIDEAHFMVRPAGRGTRQPALDWIDAGLVDGEVPICLIGTPQFATALGECERASGWNGEQFRRRFARRWIRLPDRTDREHLRALAERLLPGVGAKGWEAATAYAHSLRDVSGLADLVQDAQERAREAGRTIANLADLRTALTCDRLPSDADMAQAFAPPGGRRPGGGARGARAACEPPAEALPVRGQRPAPPSAFVPNREVQPVPHPAGAAG